MQRLFILVHHGCNNLSLKVLIRLTSLLWSGWEALFKIKSTLDNSLLSGTVVKDCWRRPPLACFPSMPLHTGEHWPPQTLTICWTMLKMFYKTSIFSKNRGGSGHSYRALHWSYSSPVYYPCAPPDTSNSLLYPHPLLGWRQGTLVPSSFSNP